MPIDVLTILALLSVTIILGYVGSILFSKTRIPDLIWLMLLGILVGPIFHIVDVNLFLTAAPLLSAVALVIILFDAGLDMNLFKVLKGFPRGFLMAIVGIVSITLVIAMISMLVFNFSFLEGAFLGIILSDTSTIVVLAIVNKLRIREEIKLLLDLESVLSDPINIVIGIAILNILVFSTATNVAENIAAGFSVGGIVGLLVGIVWLLLLRKLQGKHFDYILTISVAFLTYVLAEYLGGSGPIAGLVFGIILGNNIIFEKMLKSNNVSMEKEIKPFHAEISMFVRSFFFVSMGIIVSITPTYLLAGVGISVIILILRYFFVKIGTYKMKITEIERNLVAAMGPKGLTAAVLAQLTITYGLKTSQIYIDVTSIAILVTVLYTTVWLRIFYKPIGKKN